MRRSFDWRHSAPGSGTAGRRGCILVAGRGRPDTSARPFSVTTIPRPDGSERCTALRATIDENRTTARIDGRQQDSENVPEPRSPETAAADAMVATGAPVSKGSTSTSLAARSFSNAPWVSADQPALYSWVRRPRGRLIRGQLDRRQAASRLRDSLGGLQRRDFCRPRAECRGHAARSCRARTSENTFNAGAVRIACHAGPDLLRSDVATSGQQGYDEIDQPFDFRGRHWWKYMLAISRLTRSSTARTGLCTKTVRCAWSLSLRCVPVDAEIRPRLLRGADELTAQPGPWSVG